jgi:pimeloyl-ACP methyl ester carboxylesterase
VRRAALLSFSSLILGVSGACSSAPAAEPPVAALYGPREATRLVPFPSNRYAKPDATTKTGLRVDLRPETSGDAMVGAFPSTMEALNRLDGFSTVGPIVLGFEEEIDPTTVEDAFALVDVDDASPTRGAVLPVVTRYYTTTIDDQSDVADYTLVAQPAEPLRQRTRYAYVLTDRARSANGAPLGASGTMRALLRDEPGDYAESVRRVLPALETATKTLRDHFVLAGVFTTASVRDVVEGLAQERRAAPPPKLATPFAVQRAPTPTEKRARFVGRFEAPELRRAKPVGTFDVSAGKVAVQSTASLEVNLDFSDATQSGPRPVVIFGHGLGGDKDGTWGTSERLAALSAMGVAVVGIDAPEHGARSDPPLAPGAKTELLQSVMGFFAASTEKKTFDMERVRDNFRQMAIDQLELVRLVQSLATLDVLPVGAPDGVPDLDPARMVYLGHSFGSVMGPLVGALAPEIRAACWNVGGAGLLTLMRDSGLFSLIVNAYRPTGTPVADVARFFAVTQAIVDPGDPVNYARFNTLEALPGVPAWRAKDVLVQEVELDNIVPNSSTEMLARAAGLAHVGAPTHDVPKATRATAPVSGNLPSGATGALFQYAQADGKSATHGELIFTDEARRQYLELFRGALAGRGAVIDPKAR